MTTVFETVVRDVLGAGHAVRFRAKGDSMHPSIRCGDFVQVAPCAIESLRIGEIVLTDRRRGLTAHRIVRVVAKGSFITRGDNAGGNDEPVGADAVLGRIVVVERDGICRSLVANRYPFHDPFVRRAAVIARRAYRMLRTAFPTKGLRRGLPPAPSDRA